MAADTRLARICAKSDYIEATGCIEFGGRLDIGGYGQIAHAGKNQSVHRVAYELLVSANGLEALVLHKCDNRKCWRPDHLFLGSYADNSADMRSKGRQRKAKGTDNSKVKLTEDQVLEIYNGKESASHYARKFKVSATTALDIRNGRSWTHVTKHSTGRAAYQPQQTIGCVTNDP